jgi:hypothetical protein
LSKIYFSLEAMRRARLSKEKQSHKWDSNQSKVWNITKTSAISEQAPAILPWKKVFRHQGDIMTTDGILVFLSNFAQYMCLWSQ